MSASKNLQEVQNAIATLEKCSIERARRTERYNIAMAELKEYGIDSLDEAQEYLQKLEQKIAIEEKKATEAYNAFMEDFDSVLART